MYIAIAGNIGAGKTTLTKMLAKYYGWEPRFESVSFNPYLEDYYGDINRWAFCLETYFLKERFKDMLAVQKASHTIVQDRSIFEGVYVFVRNNYERGDLSKRDYETFMELFDLMKSQMKMPDMMIYLRKSVPALIAQIQKRNHTPIDNVENETVEKSYKYLQNGQLFIRRGDKTYDGMGRRVL